MSCDFINNIFLNVTIKLYIFITNYVLKFKNYLDLFTLNYNHCKNDIHITWQTNDYGKWIWVLNIISSIQHFLKISNEFSR